MKRWAAVLVVLAVALVGCKKKEEESSSTPAAEPAAPAEPGGGGGEGEEEEQAGGSGRGVRAAGGEQAAPEEGSATASAGDRGPATSAEENEAVLEALDDSADRLAAGLGEAFGGLAMAKHDDGEEGEGEEEDGGPPPIRRVQLHVDLAALRATPIGEMMQAGLGAYFEMMKDEDTETCGIDLVAKIDSAFLDVTLDESGEPSDVLVSFKTTASKDEAIDCIRRSLDEGEELKEVEIGGKPGYTVEPADEDGPVVLVEAGEGHWMFGMQASVEAAVDGDPEADETFRTLAGPLGPAIVRLTIVPAAGFTELASVIEEDVPPQVQCLRHVIARMQGASAGAKLGPDFALTVAIRNGSADEARETSECLSGLWDVVKPMILAEAGGEEAEQMQAMIGMTPEQFLDLLKVNADGEFAMVSFGLPADLVNKILQVVQQLQAAGAM